ncbi:MAG: chitobiase/beta-hexosaminidase C-terminal domain-containing protein [Patescibacteria group bacterium]
MKTSKILSFIFFLAAGLFISFSSAHAAVSATTTNLIASPTWVKGNSATTSAIRISLTGTGETLTAVTVGVADAGSTGFSTSDLAALATSSSSGISLYSEASGFLEASSTPVWTGSGLFLTALTLKDSITLSETPSVFFVVFKTAADLNSDTHEFIISMASDSITTSDVSPTISAVSTAPLRLDAIAPANILGDNFILGNNQILARNGSSIGMEGSVVKVYDMDGTTFLGQATLGPAGNFAPISINTTTYTSVKTRVSDQAGNLSNLVTVVADAAPYISSAAAFTDRIILDLSENVDGMQAMNCAPNYIINATSTTCGGAGNPFIDFSGTKITIRGLNLSGTVSFSVPTSTTITDLSGANNRLTAYASSSMPVQVLSLPNITNISPRSGAVGATVTITGTGFGTLGEGSIGDNNHKVLFSGGFSQQTGPLPPIEADYTGATWSTSSIVVKVPDGAQGGPVNIKAGDLMNDMGQNTFFDIAGTYTAKVYYSAGTSTPMTDEDNSNIRIVIGGTNGETVYAVGDGYMTYDADTNRFSITGVSSMGYTWAYDITGTHLNSSGKEVNTGTTQNLFMPATTRIISGTMTLGSSCSDGGRNKRVVVFAAPESISTGFKEANPAFFTTNGSCVANYAIGVSSNGVYRIEAHIQPSTVGGITASTSFTDPESQLATISDSVLTSTNNFIFSAATHKIVGHVEKPSGNFGSEERGKLWVFAYQPQEGKGTGAQVAENGTFTLNVSRGMWKIGVGGDNMPFPVEVQVEVDDTYLVGQPDKGPTIIIAPPSDFIEGYVKDAAGNGLANVSLYAWLEGGPGNGNAQTDSQGYYKMYVGPGNNYHIGANSQSFGFLGEQQGIVVSSETHPTVNFNVSSSNNYTVSGTVTKGGVGLQQAFIFITEGERGQMLGSGGTDSGGAYSARISGGSNRWIHVGLPGKGEVYKENLGTISTSTVQNITLLASTIKVRISPATDFSQAFIGVHSDQGGGFSDVDVAAGGSLYREYQIDIPRPGSGSTTYYVEGGIPGYGPLVQNTIVVNSNGTFTEASGTANDGIIEYTLGGFYSVSGTVTGSDSNGGAWIWTSGSNGGGGAQTADDGTYTLKLRNGTYDIGVGKPGYIGNKITVTVSGAPLTGKDLTLSAAESTIAGTVYLPNGVTKVTNARVWAQNNTGGWSGGSTDANGTYSLNVGSGNWNVQAAYDGYNSTSTLVTAPATGTNITLATIVGFSANLKNSPITPSSGGIIQEDGIKVDFPKNSLGTGSSAGTVEVKNTTNVPTVASTKVIGNARDITARNSSNQNITTLSGSITIEFTVTKAEIEEQGLSFSQVQGMKISYWDSTANNWVEIPTSVTLHPATAASLNDLDSDPAVTLSGTVSHLSSFAPTVPADDAPATPSGLAATLYRPTQINLSWSAVSGATSYDIYRNTSGSGDFPRIGSEPTVASGLTTTYSDSGLATSTIYYYKISALNASGESAASAVASTTTTIPSSVTGDLNTGLNSNVGNMDGVVVAAPTPSPAASTYSSTQSVTLAAAGSTAICYTVDGSTPSCSNATTCSAGTLYSGAISITSTKTIKSLACYNNNSAGPVATSVYTISSSSSGSTGGGSPATVYCSSVTYSDWGASCFGNIQTRSVLTSTPSSCTLITAQQAAAQRTCQTTVATSTPPTTSTLPPASTPSTPSTPPAPVSPISNVLGNIATESGIVSANNTATLLTYLGKKANALSEQASLVKYKTILGQDKKITTDEKESINDFIVYGTPTTQRLGVGERAGVTNSYYQAYGKLPNAGGEWSDVLKIASGRWPSERNIAAENQAKLEFKKVYARNAVMANKADSNAIMVIAYGLLPTQRNLASEAAAIKSFRWVYGHQPVNALAWNVVRAVSYSGAKK